MVKKSTESAKPVAAAGGGYCCLIRNGAVFRGSLKDACAQAEAAIEAEPLVKTLIVSSETLPGDRLKVKTPGNALYVNYRRIAGKK